MHIVSQSQTDNWFFADKSGLKFTSTFAGVQPISEIFSTSGSAAFSTYNRELLFYSNGATVWNANHEIMENGNDLSGEIDNTQSSIIIPKPGSDTNYYVFTTRKNGTNTQSSGVKYSEIEISNQYPLGKVISKNVILNPLFTEKITAVYSADGQSIFVIVFGSENNESDAPFDTFSVYEVDENGVSNRTFYTFANTRSTSSAGALKASPDGKTLALAVYDFNENEGLYLFDFDNTTGTITYRKQISMNMGPGVWSIPYGLEFSQNSKQLFYSGELNAGASLIRQVNIDESVGNSEPETIASSNAVNFRGLQLASNGKIYIAKTKRDEEESFENTIGVIASPENEPGESGFILRDSNYKPLNTSRGFPNFISSLFQSKITTSNQCFIDPFEFNATSYTNITGIEWSFGDGNTGSGINYNHTYNSPGVYNVEALLTLDNGTKTIIYTQVEAYALPVLNPNQSLVECDDDSDGLSTFNLNLIRTKISNGANEELFFYLNQNDLGTDTAIQNPERFQNTVQNQEIIVKVVNENGCFETTTFTVSAKFVALANISNFYTCEDSDGIVGNNQGTFNATSLEASIRNQLNIPASTSLAFYRTKQDAQTNSNALQGNFSATSTVIFVKGQEADLSCAGIQGFNLVVNANLNITLEETYTICFDPSLKPPVIISGDASFDRFEWKNENGETLSVKQNFTLSRIGTYSLTVYKSENGIECSNSKSFTVVNPEPPRFGNITVNTEDETNNIVTVNVIGNSTYEFSLDNTSFFGSGSLHSFTNVAAGLRTVFVRDLNYCEQSIQVNVSVIGFQDYFTPNGDGKNDYWTIKGLDESNFKSVNVKVYNRFGKIIFSMTDFSSMGWNGNYNGKPLTANTYWFKAEIVDKDDNIIKKSGNFSLIRDR